MLVAAIIYVSEWDICLEVDFWGRFSTMVLDGHSLVATTKDMLEAELEAFLKLE